MERLQTLQVVPTGWSLEGDSIVRGVYSPLCSYGIMRINNCHWKIFINDHKIPLNIHTLHQFSEEVCLQLYQTCDNKCDKVVNVLSNAQQSRLCIGCPDVNFCRF